jgi:hypothetical protein
VIIEKIPVVDRASWLVNRSRDVTASVAGCLLGVHEYQTRFGLWALKTGRLTEDPEETPAMRRGRLLEPVAVALLREEHPEIGIEPGRVYYRNPDARLGATPDALAMCPRRGLGVVQIKSVDHSVFRQKWRRGDGSTEPPLWIAIQAIVEAHLVGASWAAVAPLRVGMGLDIDLIDIPIHTGIIDALYRETAEFWRICETAEFPPLDYTRDAEVIDAIYPTDDGTEIDLSGDNELPGLLDERATLSASGKQIDERRAAIDAALKSKLGPHTRGVLPGATISWKLQKRSGGYVPPSEFRVLRVNDKRKKDF